MGSTAALSCYGSLTMLPLQSGDTYLAKFMVRSLLTTMVVPGFLPSVREVTLLFEE